MAQQQHEPQQEQLHRAIVSGIARCRLYDPAARHRDHERRRHTLSVMGWTTPRILDRHSWQHLVDFLNNAAAVVDDDESVVVEPTTVTTTTQLELCDIRLLTNPNTDGGLNVLQRFFSRGDTTLTKVEMYGCDFGTAQDAAQLLAAFQTNATVTDLTIRRIENLEEATLGNSLSGLMRANVIALQLHRLDCTCSSLRAAGVRAFQPSLQTNRTMRELVLYGCQLGNGGIRSIADALVGNTTMDVLNIGGNTITFIGLPDVTRILESTRLKTIKLDNNEGVFDNKASTRDFARILSRHGFLKVLCLSCCELGDKGILIIANALDGNTIMDMLDIGGNDITSVGLANITRLLVSTQLKTITVVQLYDEVFNDEEATQHFVTTLQHKKSSVQEILGIVPYDLPGDEDDQIATLASIRNSLTRNQQLNRVDLLLAPLVVMQQPATGTTTNTTTTIM
jgi:Leucine Rich repeat